MNPLRASWVPAPPPGWDALLQGDPGAAPSLQPQVAQALAQGLSGMRAEWLCIEAGQELLGGAPVLLERRAGAQWLHALPMMLSGAPIARPGSHAAVDAEVARAFAERLRTERLAGGAWACYRPEGPPVPDPALEALPGETRWVEAAVIPLRGGPEAALKRIDRKSRQSLQQTLTRSLQFAEDPAALEQAYALHLAQRTQWGASRALPLELSRRLLAGAVPTARLFTVRDGRGLLAATLALDGPHETFLWWSGTHTEGRRSQAFTRLVWGIVEWASARGRARVDLGASTGLVLVADFKRSLGAEGVRYPVRWFGPSSAAGPAALIGQLRTWLRRRRPLGERT